MLKRILEHINNDYKELLPLYVKHFCKRDDVAEAELIDVNEEEMTLLVNGKEKVKIKFSKRTEMEKIPSEMIKLAKIAGSALNEKASENFKEKSHLKEVRGHPSESSDTEPTEAEKKGEFAKRFKSHADSTGVISNYFRKRKKMITEEELFNFLENRAEEERGVIYVHVPYCDKICSFCNLNRKQLDNDLEEYTEFLVSEFEKYGKTAYMKSKRIEVIFFGGGTPSILKSHQIEKILKSIHENYNVAEDCEFTFETTLHNLNRDKLEIMQKYGVNRLSVGIQTFSQKGRDLLNRTFSGEEAVKRLKELKETFKGMVCTDIIYNYPEETVEEVVEDADTVSSLEIDSTSFYSLMIHEGSQMSRDIRENTLELNYELETDRKLHHSFLKRLLETGKYEVMEHTKVVRKGRDRYNYIRYTHQGADILPIGVGAGGKLGGVDIFRISSEKAFYMMSQNEKEEKRFKIIGGLFQYPKVYFSVLKEYISEDIFNEIYKLFKNFEKKGYMKVYDTHIELTLEGIFWGNNIGSVILKKCLGGYVNEKTGGVLHINGKYGKNS